MSLPLGSFGETVPRGFQPLYHSGFTPVCDSDLHSPLLRLRQTISVRPSHWPTPPHTSAHIQEIPCMQAQPPHMTTMTHDNNATHTHIHTYICSYLYITRCTHVLRAHTCNTPTHATAHSHVFYHTSWCMPTITCYLCGVSTHVVQHTYMDTRSWCLPATHPPWCTG